MRKCWSAFFQQVTYHPRQTSKRTRSFICLFRQNEKKGNIIPRDRVILPFAFYSVRARVLPCRVERSIRMIASIIAKQWYRRRSRPQQLIHCYWHAPSSHRPWHSRQHSQTEYPRVDNNFAKALILIPPMPIKYIFLPNSKSNNCIQYYIYI